MRITGGQARGIPLTSGKASQLRPATDRMREAVFSSIGSIQQGALFLDLFAGTGAYGLEALSRGATGGTFVEKDPRASTALQQNLNAVCRSLDADSYVCEILKVDVLQLPVPTAPSFELIFIDPPYAGITEKRQRLFALAARHLKPETSSRLVFEMSAELPAEQEGWTVVRRLGGKSRGDPSAVIYQPLPPADPAAED